MAKTTRFYAVIITLLVATSSNYAGSCGHSIDRVQAQVDAAIDERAGSGPWAPESIDALRGHQPTPRSIARAEETLGNGSGLKSALNALGRARDADRSTDITLCNDELNEARRALGLHRH
jgi:hypothetical protein